MNLLTDKIYTVYHQTRSGNFVKSNRFSFFYHWKESEIFSIISHHTLSMLPHYLWEFKSLNLSTGWSLNRVHNAHPLISFNMFLHFVTLTFDLLT